MADEIIPTLDARDPARQVACTDGLRLGPTKIVVSTILRPNMCRATARHIPPYETIAFDDKGSSLMEWTSRSRAEAEQCHREVVDILRFVQRARMRRCHQMYRQRRR